MISRFGSGLLLFFLTKTSATASNIGGEDGGERWLEIPDTQRELKGVGKVPAYRPLFDLESETLDTTNSAGYSSVFGDIVKSENTESVATNGYTSVFGSARSESSGGLHALNLDDGTDGSDTSEKSGSSPVQKPELSKPNQKRNKRGYFSKEEPGGLRKGGDRANPKPARKKPNRKRVNQNNSPGETFKRKPNRNRAKPGNPADSKPQRRKPSRNKKKNKDEDSPGGGPDGPRDAGGSEQDSKSEQISKEKRGNKGSSPDAEESGRKRENLGEKKKNEVKSPGHENKSAPSSTESTPAEEIIHHKVATDKNNAGKTLSGETGQTKSVNKGNASRGKGSGSSDDESRPSGKRGKGRGSSKGSKGPKSSKGSKTSKGSEGSEGSKGSNSSKNSNGSKGSRSSNGSKGSKRSKGSKSSRGTSKSSKGSSDVEVPVAFALCYEAPELTTEPTEEELDDLLEVTIDFFTEYLEDFYEHSHYDFEEIELVLGESEFQPGFYCTEYIGEVVFEKNAPSPEEIDEILSQAPFEDYITDFLDDLDSGFGSTTDLDVLDFFDTQPPPTAVPTFSPTTSFFPTSSFFPTFQSPEPSIVPSSDTLEPSSFPSVQPSSMPVRSSTSSAPSESSSPSLLPSAIPSSMPSTADQSADPSSLPSSIPSFMPSPTDQSSEPSSLPSSIPSIMPSPTPANLFEIDLDLTNVDAQYQGAFTVASDRWEEVITGDLAPTPTSADVIANSVCQNIPAVVDDVHICAFVEPIDGEFGILGQAQPEFVRANLLPTVGLMRFDTADVDRLVADGEFDEVILHEMGHVVSQTCTIALSASSYVVFGH